MSLSKSKCWYLNNCLHFLKCTVPLWHGGREGEEKLKTKSPGFDPQPGQTKNLL
jgi:hypothetical protein